MKERARERARRKWQQTQTHSHRDRKDLKFRFKWDRAKQQQIWRKDKLKRRDNNPTIQNGSRFESIRCALTSKENLSKWKLIYSLYLIWILENEKKLTTKEPCDECCRAREARKEQNIERRKIESIHLCNHNDSVWMKKTGVLLQSDNRIKTTVLTILNCGEREEREKIIRFFRRIELIWKRMRDYRFF